LTVKDIPEENLVIIKNDKIKKQTAPEEQRGLTKISCNATPGVRQNILPKNTNEILQNGVYNNVFDEVFTLIR